MYRVKDESSLLGIPERTIRKHCQTGERRAFKDERGQYWLPHFCYPYPCDEFYQKEQEAVLNSLQKAESIVVVLRDLGRISDREYQALCAGIQPARNYVKATSKERIRKEEDLVELLREMPTPQF